VAVFHHRAKRVDGGAIARTETETALKSIIIEITGKFSNQKFKNGGATVADFRTPTKR